MRGRFLSSLVFALMAALAAIPWLLATAPLLGQSDSLEAFAVIMTGAYLWVIAPTPALGLRAAVLASVVGGSLWLLFPTHGLQSMAALLTLGLIRSGWLYKRSTGRAFAVEALLALVAVFASMVLQDDSSLFAQALAVWGFWFMQSLYFLVSDLEARPAEPERDAFELAHEKALRLLEQTGS